MICREQGRVLANSLHYSFVLKDLRIPVQIELQKLYLA